MNLRRRLLAGFAIVAVLAACGREPGPGTEEATEIVAWNLQFFPGRNAQSSAEEEAAHMAAARTVVGELAPDVLCLLEIKTREAAAELVAALQGQGIENVTTVICGDYSMDPGGGNWEEGQWGAIGTAGSLPKRERDLAAARTSRALPILRREPFTLLRP